MTTGNRVVTSTLGTKGVTLTFTGDADVHVEVLESDGTTSTLDLDGIPGNVADLVALGADVDEKDVENGVPFLEIIVDEGVTGTLDNEEIKPIMIAELLGRAIVDAISVALDKIEARRRFDEAE